MNNSLLMIENASLEMEEETDVSPRLRERETELLAILEALKNISTSKFWKTLENKLFTPDFNSALHKLRKEKNPTEMYRLQGRLDELEKLSKLSTLQQIYINELSQIRTTLTIKNDE